MLQTSRTLRYAGLGTALAALTALGACNDPAAPAAGLSLTTDSSVSGAGALISCPTATPKATSGLLRVLGGVVSLDGTSITLPFGAITRPTQFALALPSSQFMEVEITADNQEHFLFRLPVTVTVDYSRCASVQGELTVWHIDPVTKAKLEDMGGTDLRLLRKITFTTPHLSSYAIANRTTTPPPEGGVE